MRISDWSSDVCSSDLLTFPNLSRSYDARRDLVRFWGYDSALEVAFFVETSALCKLRPETGKLEAAYLAAFDAAREQILAVAHTVYSPARPGPFLLAEAAFCLPPASHPRPARSAEGRAGARGGRTVRSWWWP